VKCYFKEVRQLNSFLDKNKPITILEDKEETN